MVGHARSKTSAFEVAAWLPINRQDFLGGTLAAIRPQAAVAAASDYTRAATLFILFMTTAFGVLRISQQ